MDGYKIVGHCLKCGAPIYAAYIVSDLPPRSIYSCMCNVRSEQKIISTKDTKE